MAYFAVSSEMRMIWPWNKHTKTWYCLPYAQSVFGTITVGWVNLWSAHSRREEALITLTRLHRTHMPAPCQRQPLAAPMTLTPTRATPAQPRQHPEPGSSSSPHLHLHAGTCTWTGTHTRMLAPVPGRCSCRPAPPTKSSTSRTASTAFRVCQEGTAGERATPSC
jgi:hypothetical protein